jgi:hypothetical protein
MSSSQISPIISFENIELPDYLLEVLAGAPINVDRSFGAALVTKNIFPISPRTLEAWPLPTRRVNGKAIMSTATLFKVAYAKLMAAPVTMGGKQGVC